MLPPMSHPAAGWYTDPEQHGTQRYWDGTAWTEHRSPAGTFQVVAPVAVAVPTAARPPANGLATAGLVCGIVAVVFGLVPWTFWLAWILGVLGIVFGAVGRRTADREPTAGKRSMATAGLILGIVAIVLGIVGLVILETWINDVKGSLDHFQNCFDNPDQVRCD